VSASKSPCINAFCATNEGTTPHRSDVPAPSRVALADRSQAYGAGLQSEGRRRRWRGPMASFPFLKKGETPRTYLQTTLVLEALCHIASPFATANGAKSLLQLRDIVQSSSHAVCTMAVFELF